MPSLARGQKSKLADLTPSLELRAGLSAQAPGVTFDFSCFGVDAGDKLSDDRYFVFFNQKSSPEGALKQSGAQDGDSETFEIDLSRLPTTVRKLVFVMTIDGNGTLSQLARFDFSGKDFGSEKAIIAAEIYFKDEWRVGAVGQGFNGGLNALLKYFGGEEIEEAAPTHIPAVAEKAPPSKAPSAVSSIRLDKITLAKKEKVSIAKATRITAALEWQGDGDLDLYCFYVDANGREDKVYYRNLGRTDVFPYIALDGDSQTPGRETIIIARPDALRYALFAAYSAVENGTGSFESYQPQAIITDDRNQTVVVPILERNEFSYWVAITLIDFTQPAGNIINHVETYGDEGEESSPLLNANGTFEMDVGPVEFK